MRLGCGVSGVVHRIDRQAERSALLLEESLEIIAEALARKLSGIWEWNCHPTLFQAFNSSPGSR